MSVGSGSPPKSGWPKVMLELHVNDLDVSLAFWRGVLGFGTAYERPEGKFVYLEHPQGHQIMLCQRHGGFETGPMVSPLGQGVMLQFYFERLEPVLAALGARNWPLYMEPREIWRQVGGEDFGQREAFVQDPDGYLLMLAEHLGIRPR